jgi:hypothetical protein
MKYGFKLHVSGIDLGRDSREDALYEAGCDDALIAVVDGTSSWTSTEKVRHSSALLNLPLAMSSRPEERSSKSRPPE